MLFPTDNDRGGPSYPNATNSVFDVLQIIPIRVSHSMCFAAISFNRLMEVLRLVREDEIAMYESSA